MGKRLGLGAVQGLDLVSPDRHRYGRCFGRGSTESPVMSQTSSTNSGSLASPEGVGAVWSEVRTYAYAPRCSVTARLPWRSPASTSGRCLLGSSFEGPRSASGSTYLAVIVGGTPERTDIANTRQTIAPEVTNATRRHRLRRRADLPGDRLGWSCSLHRRARSACARPGTAWRKAACPSFLNVSPLLTARSPTAARSGCLVWLPCQPTSIFGSLGSYLQPNPWDSRRGPPRGKGVSCARIRGLSSLCYSGEGDARLPALGCPG